MPHVAPLQPDPETVQETAEFEAVKTCEPDVGTDALVGVMLMPEFEAATLTFAEADLVGSAMLVAVTSTDSVASTELGGV